MLGDGVMSNDVTCHSVLASDDFSAASVASIGIILIKAINVELLLLI